MVGVPKRSMSLRLDVLELLILRMAFPWNQTARDTDQGQIPIFTAATMRERLKPRPEKSALDWSEGAGLRTSWPSYRCQQLALLTHNVTIDAYECKASVLASICRPIVSDYYMSQPSFTVPVSFPLANEPIELKLIIDESPPLTLEVEDTELSAKLSGLREAAGPVAGLLPRESTLNDMKYEDYRLPLWNLAVILVESSHCWLARVRTVPHPVFRLPILEATNPRDVVDALRLAPIASGGVGDTAYLALLHAIMSGTRPWKPTKTAAANLPMKNLTGDREIAIINYDLPVRGPRTRAVHGVALVNHPNLLATYACRYCVERGLPIKRLQQMMAAATSCLMRGCTTIQLVAHAHCPVAAEVCMIIRPLPKIPSLPDDILLTRGMFFCHIIRWGLMAYHVLSGWAAKCRPEEGCLHELSWDYWRNDWRNTLCHANKLASLNDYFSPLLDAWPSIAQTAANVLPQLEASHFWFRDPALDTPHIEALFNTTAAKSEEANGHSMRLESKNWGSLHDVMLCCLGLAPLGASFDLRDSVARVLGMEMMETDSGSWDSGRTAEEYVQHEQLNNT